MNELLLTEDVRTLLKISLAALIALWVGIRYYRVIKADEDAELTVLRGYRSFQPPRRYEDMDEDERLSAQRRAEAQGWLDDYDEDDLEQDQRRLSA